MIKTACYRQINLVVIKTHDLTNEWPFDCCARPFDCCALRDRLSNQGPAVDASMNSATSAALRLFIPLRCMNAQGPAVEPGTAFDASMNSATSAAFSASSASSAVKNPPSAAASSASSAVKKALRLLRPQGPAVEPGTAFGCCIRCARQFLVCMPVIPYLYPLNCKHVE
jgi:hypothetical protein